MQAIQADAGGDGFEYLGNDAADIPIWSRAAIATQVAKTLDHVTSAVLPVSYRRTRDTLLELQRFVRRLPTSKDVHRYAVRIARATRGEGDAPHHRLPVARVPGVPPREGGQHARAHPHAHADNAPNFGNASHTYTQCH